MDVFLAVSDPVRRGLLEALADGPKPVKSLVDRFPISQPAISRHLRVLRDAGLVETGLPADDGRLRLYRLRPEPMVQLQRWLQLFWQRKLDAFADYAKERR
jgi:DNA-binding transcriptional ArsR family regulator